MDMDFARAPDVTGAADIATRLAERLTAGTRVVIDATAWDEIDVSGLSVLLAGFESAARAGASLAIRLPEDGPFLDALDALGLAAAGRQCDDAGLWTGVAA